MGSVQSNINCPICNSDNCIEDYYYKSDELYIFCDNCGYTKEITLKLDENKNPILDENGHFIYETKEQKGRGIVRLSLRGNSGVSKVYTIPYDKIEKKRFLNKVWKYRKKYPDTNVEIKHYKEM